MIDQSAILYGFFWRYLNLSMTSDEKTCTLSTSSAGSQTGIREHERFIEERAYQYTLSGEGPRHNDREGDTAETSGMVKEGPDAVYARTAGMNATARPKFPAMP